MNNSDQNADNQSNGSDHADRSGDESAPSIGPISDQSRNRSDLRIAERLTDLFSGGGDVDLVVQRSDGENTVLQWLQAMDMQVMGACRSDERLKPLLKLNASNGEAEDRLLSYLSQHFEPSEVGLLARCLCIPLVSIRVGKVNKQGTQLCPTNARGNLTLALLPTSDLRISFVGDDGHVERLSTWSNISDCSSVEIEEIPADNSGRSFLMKIPNRDTLYFWCSEKSKLLGTELLEKMKSLLKRKPSLAELTGISESRLGSFATHIRAYLISSNTPVSSAASRTPSTMTPLDSPETCQSTQLPSLSPKPQRPRQCCIQGARASSFHQGSLSPRPSTFKEGFPRSLATLKTVVREKFRRRGEDLSSLYSPITSDTPLSNDSEKVKLPESSSGFWLPPSSSTESVHLPFLTPTSHVSPPMVSSLLSPYYCWCPPIASTVPYTPLSSTESFTLPPLSSLLSNAPRSSTLLMPTPTLDLSKVSPMDFPHFLPEPLVRLPMSIPSSTFTPLMCDSIVHVPVMDICSSGPAYLVSAGPALSSSIPNPLLKETESMVEKSARETLRLLISGTSQSNSELMGVLPSVITNSNDRSSVVVAGSRGIYEGAMDIKCVPGSISAMSLVSLPGRSSSGVQRSFSHGDFVDFHEEQGGSGANCSCDLSEQGGSAVSKFADTDLGD